MIKRLRDYLFATVLAGCFSPNLTSGTVHCGPENQCPPRMDCYYAGYSDIKLCYYPEDVPKRNDSSLDLGIDVTDDSLERKVNDVDGGENKDGENIWQDAGQIDAPTKNCPEPRPYNTHQEGVCAGSLQECIRGQWQDSAITQPNFEGVEVTCDGLDNDCDGIVDEGLGSTFYRDNDGDGFGIFNQTITACTAPEGYVADNTDCYDSRSNVHPSLDEVCDGLDNDCDNDIDEGVLQIFYQDADGDGFGNQLQTIDACTAPTGHVSDNTDCDDAHNDMSPGLVSGAQEPSRVEAY